MSQRYFPMFVDISKEKIAVIGGGTIGIRRLRTLMEFVDQVTLVEPNPGEEIRKMAESGQILLIQDRYRKEYIEDAYMVVAATDQKEVNHQVKEDCLALEKEQNRKILVNISDDRSLNDFYFPGIVIEGDLVIGINSGGASPALVKETRKKLEKVLREK